MTSILVYYGTGEGQTAKIADRVVDAVSDRGHEARAGDAADGLGDLSLDDFDAVIVGASIHAGKHQSAVGSFVNANREALAAKPTAFFQVSMSSATENGRDTAAGYVEEFLDATGWHPDRIAMFGGALRFSEYGFLKRLFVKQIAKREFPDVNRSADVEFTEWQAVADFANDIAAFVEARLGVTPPRSGTTTE